MLDDELGRELLEHLDQLRGTLRRVVLPAGRLGHGDQRVLIDRPAEAAARSAEAAEAAKKKAEDEKIAKAKAENCTRARAAKAAFDAGKPITQTNAQGERIFLDGPARAAEAKRIDGIVASDCAR